MITKYGELWPDNPFIFYVPYNSVTRHTAQSRFEELLDVVNLTHTRYPIAETILDLFDACGCREEIIFYAIDDRYPIGLNANILRQVLPWVLEKSQDARFGWLDVGYHRGTPNNGKDVMVSEQKVPLIKTNSDPREFWSHKFVKGEILRGIYALAESKAAQLNDTKETTEGKKLDHAIIWTHIRGLPRIFSTYVVSQPVIFGETSHRGHLLPNAAREIAWYAAQNASRFWASDATQLPGRGTEIFLGPFAHVRRSDDWESHVRYMATAAGLPPDVIPPTVSLAIPAERRHAWREFTRVAVCLIGRDLDAFHVPVVRRAFLFNVADAYYPPPDLFISSDEAPTESETAELHRHFSNVTMLRLDPGQASLIAHGQRASSFEWARARARLCKEAIEAVPGAPYDWVIRLRPDHVVFERLLLRARNPAYLYARLRTWNPHAEYALEVTDRHVAHGEARFSNITRPASLGFTHIVPLTNITTYCILLDDQAAVASMINLDAMLFSDTTSPQPSDNAPTMCSRDFDREQHTPIAARWGEYHATKAFLASGAHFALLGWQLRLARYIPTFLPPHTCGERDAHKTGSLCRGSALNIGACQFPPCGGPFWIDKDVMVTAVPPRFPWLNHSTYQQTILGAHRALGHV